MSRDPAHSPYDVCTCAQLRKATRTVTQHYDAALRPAGLKVTQYSILRALEATGGIAMGALADRLALERTTLTRNLRPLERDGLVGIVPGPDTRTRLVRLTRLGHDRLERANPLWRAAQDRIVDALGAAQAGRLLGDLADIRRAASN